MNDPISLQGALDSSRDLVYMLDGIYTMDTMAIPANVTIKAANGARPVVVHSDGYPPTVNRGGGAEVHGVWFGGLRPETDEGFRTVVNGAGGGFADCTFFNYINAIQDGSTGGNIYRRNRLVNCGYGVFLHPLYVSTVDVLAEENIFVGCEGYSIHYYHQPARSLAQYNFVGDALHGMALQGNETGPVSGNRNIIWGVSGVPLYISVTTGNCDQNVWQGCTAIDQAGVDSQDGNIFVDPVPTGGTNPVVWNDADVVANFGKTPAEIAAAMAALELAFTENVAAIHASAEIDAHFVTLKSVIDTWKTI